MKRLGPHRVTVCRRVFFSPRFGWEKFRKKSAWDSVAFLQSTHCLVFSDKTLQTTAVDVSNRRFALRRAVKLSPTFCSDFLGRKMNLLRQQSSLTQHHSLLAYVS
ncbi:hypothetical protein L5515_018542 [Caenorhabditis briggsae]|uniref:Uncharacterized protein n=1 Tax=Caenorhabditis briggsae TaxID=6238 RepID=A0AAE9JST5_CAEBR|nr:hypothetical protein L5515_018542 [Caenorhabditis briggsae]